MMFSIVIQCTLFIHVITEQLKDYLETNGIVLVIDLSAMHTWNKVSVKYNNFSLGFREKCIAYHN